MRSARWRSGAAAHQLRGPAGARVQRGRGSRASAAATRGSSRATAVTCCRVSTSGRAMREAAFEVIGRAPRPKPSRRGSTTRSPSATAELVRARRAATARLPVVLTGGCFQNARLTESLAARPVAASRCTRTTGCPPETAGSRSGRRRWRRPERWTAGRTGGGFRVRKAQGTGRGRSDVRCCGSRAATAPQRLHGRAPQPRAVSWSVRGDRTCVSVCPVVWSASTVTSRTSTSGACAGRSGSSSSTSRSRPGDYILNHVGFAIRRIPAEDASPARSRSTRSC